ncbi:MAG: hypothetical protein WAX44_00325 [Minisyncoccia bacterium]
MMDQEDLEGAQEINDYFEYRDEGDNPHWLSYLLDLDDDPAPKYYTRDSEFLGYYDMVDY